MARPDMFPLYLFIYPHSHAHMGFWGYKDLIIEVGSSSVIAEMGLPQGSVLSPVLFNAYLEEALGSSELLKKVRSRGDLLAFADDMLIMSNER